MDTPNILFLDDDERRCNSFRSAVPYATIVNTSAECIEQLGKDDWDYVFLDHDLGGEIYCDCSRHDVGMEVVRWITTHNPTIEHIIVHTYNAPAGDLMEASLRDASYHVIRAPFALMMSAISQIIES